MYEMILIQICTSYMEYAKGMYLLSTFDLIFIFCELNRFLKEYMPQKMHIPTLKCYNFKRNDLPKGKIMCTALLTPK